MSTRRLLFVGDHAVPLASGGSVGPGEYIAESKLNLKDPHDARLVDEGLLVNVTEAREEAKADAGEEANK